METTMIFDGHAYCFPDVRGDLEFPSADAQRIHVQKAMANHHVQPWRTSDRTTGSTTPLLNLEMWPEDDAAQAVNFRPTRNGRYEWTIDGEDYVKQYFPPSITDMAYPAQNLIAEMDYANVSEALLHRNPYLGIGNSFIADCVRRYPERLYGLAHVPEWRVADEPEASANEVRQAVDDGLSGLQFLSSQLHLYGTDAEWADDRYLLFWDDVASLGVPVFFSLNVNEPKREPRLEHYLAELMRLLHWMERYPDVNVMLTHGFPWSLFIQDGAINLPDAVWDPFANPRLSLQILFAIGLGGIWDFPLPQTRPMIEEAVNRIGADRIVWGNDMPIVMRHWTYQQNIDFIVDYCDFLSDADRRMIMGGTTCRLLGLDFLSD
jgi:predicted TIM-barrel fold metal-dependent hydrolase